jgi:CheY-like chemotaxis protein
MKKILFIEDETDHITMMQTRLEAAGYQFLSATDGEKGLAIAKREIPDLILLDIIMPVMNGYEVCYALKRDEATKNIPIIIVTASGAKKLEQKCIEVGAQEILHKPYDSKYLTERIEHYVNGG